MLSATNLDCKYLFMSSNISVTELMGERNEVRAVAK